MTPIFYHPKQSGTAFDFISVKKLTKFVDLADRVANSKFEPVTSEQLYTAHDRGHVDDVLCGNADNGFKNRDPSLNTAVLYSNGCFVAAAKYALETAALRARCLRVSTTPDTPDRGDIAHLTLWLWPRRLCAKTNAF